MRTSNFIVAVLVWTSLILLISPSLLARDLYLAPEGKGDGSKESPLSSLAAAAQRAKPGDTIFMKPAIYKMTDRLILRSSGAAGRPITLRPDGEGTVILDFSAQSITPDAGGLFIAGDWWLIQDVEVVGAGNRGICIINGGYNTLDRCIARENRFAGITLVHKAHHNLIVNCESYRNFDPQDHGEHADGFAASGIELGPGNIFRNCRSWENSDDGFDLWQALNPVRLENCVAFRNGVNVWNIPDFKGDGNGFKLGGKDVGAPHVVIGCVAVDQPAAGFAQNGNLAGQTLERCTAINCRMGFVFSAVPRTGRHTLRDNVTYNAPSHIAPGSIEQNNHWTTAPTGK